MITWLLLGLALGLGGRASPGSARKSAAERRLSPRSLEAIAALATAVSSVLLVGVGRGLVAATLIAPLVVAGVRRARDRPPRAGDCPSLALALDLASIALRTGQPLGAALLAAAPVAGDAGGELVRVAGLLRLGADPRDAWVGVSKHAVLAPVAAAARRSATSGVRLAAAFEALAADLRAQRRVAGQTRAQRVGVLAAAPLGLCFLPSFVCLGIVPALIGLASAALR